MALPVIEIKDLTVIFGEDETELIAVNNISFTVDRGEIVAIVGESGSGKTITSLSILKLVPEASQKTTGSILFSSNGNNHINISVASEKEIRKIRGNGISMIFQEPMTSLNPLMKCGIQVIEALRVHNKISYADAKMKTIDLFAKVDLPNPELIINKYPHQLSGGQKQRVMIAMAMSCNPSLLIADEPTTALDVTVQKTILKLLKELQTQNEMGVIYITHDLALVADIADRIIVMLKGNIVEEGTVGDIFRNPQHPYTKALLACRPNNNSKGKRLPVINDFLNPSTSSSAEQITRSFNTPTKTITNLIEVKDLVIKYPIKRNLFGSVTKEFTAIDNISFTIRKGETLGIVGESGSGKTTLGRSLLKLINTSSGNILLNGKDIASLSESELRNIRKEIQIIFQDPFGSLNPRITIGNAIEEPLKVHHPEYSSDKTRSEVLELLQKVDLKAEHFSRYPHQFSGGQRQRICIARALALNPDFIVCDESVSALDISVQAQVLNLLTDLKAELGFTCVFISHDLSVVRYISDRIMVMKNGTIVETGMADDIFFSPKEEYTRQLISSIPKGVSHQLT